MWQVASTARSGADLVDMGDGGPREGSGDPIPASFSEEEVR